METRCWKCNKVLTDKTGVRIEDGYFDSYLRKFRPKNLSDDITWALCKKCITKLKNRALNKISEYPKGKTEIWYFKHPELLLFGIDPDVKIPTFDTLKKTHVLLGKIAETHFDRIFEMMQADFWDPNAQGQYFILSKGLQHTSMSVGDVIKIGDRAWIVAPTGFQEINREGI